MGRRTPTGERAGIRRLTTSQGQNTYSIAKINDLAAEPTFASGVRALAKGLIADGLVYPQNLKTLAPLVGYGVDNAGSALRLNHIPRWAELSGERAAEWVVLVDRLQEAEV